MSDALWTLRRWSESLADPDYRKSTMARVLASVSVTDAGCWEWQRRLTYDGYGVIQVKNHSVRAHAVALAIRRGAMWPRELQVDHLCRNRACCNPEHLELVTSAENSRRGLKPQQFYEDVVAPQKAQTSCLRGHDFDEANTYWAPNGRRGCRKCRAATERRRKAALRAAKRAAA